MHLRSTLAKLFVLFALIVCPGLFLPEAAFAGNGKFKDGKFDFCVSVRFNATPAQLQEIRDVFERASAVLQDATDGHHRFGTITIVNNSGAGEAADFWIKPGSWRAYAPWFGIGIQYGVWGQHVSLFYEDDIGDIASGDGRAYTVVHEFAHLAYSVEDEYSGPNLPFFDAECAAPALESPTLNFCIMDNYFKRGAHRTSSDYSLNEFCSFSNHDRGLNTPVAAFNTWQHLVHGQSCWETIASNPKWPIPAPDPPDDEPGLGVGAISQEGSSDRRFMLLMDRSGSMLDDSKMTLAKIAANQFITYARDGMNLGVASFADSGILNFFLTPINESNRPSAMSAVNALQASGATNIGHGLQIALAEIEAQTEACCTQAIVLISDGDHNVGTPPAAVIPALVDAGVAVFTLGLGTGISASGEATLQNLATATGGKYYRVSDPSRILIAIKNILFVEALGSGPSRQAPLAVTTGQVTEVPVPVEQGAARAAFVVHQINSADSITLSLRTPSGQIITPNDGSGGNPNIRHRVDAFTKGFQIFNPEPGTWTMTITAGSITNGTLNVQGLVEHEGTKLTAFVKNELATYPQPFHVTAASTWEGERVVGGSMTGNVVHPQGVSAPITLFDDGSAVHGDFIANDGIYSEIFNYAEQFGQHYRNGLPIAGSYTIELTATVTNGRKFEGEVKLYPDPPPAEQPVPAFTRLVSTTAIVANVPTDATVPTCQPTNCNAGPPASCDLTVQDTGVGLSLINVISANNVNVNVPAFAAGTTSPVVVTGTLINPNSNGSFEIQSIDVVGNSSTCSRTVTAAAPPILGDDFNDNSIDTAKWTTENSFTGFTSLLVPIAETSQRLEIGPLLQTISNQYRGLRSVNAFNFTGANCYVELVQAASSTTDAEALFNVGNNINNISLYYRIYVRHGTLFGERKTGSTAKTTLFSIPYDAVAHRFLRIRHNAGSVTLDTAPSNGGVPGTWVQRYTATWHSSIPLTSVLIEMRGGTFKQETNPGKVIFDNFVFSLNP